MALTRMEERYVALDLKAHWEPLSKVELAEVTAMQAVLNIKPCEQCEGVGEFYMPCIIGYGTEYAPCKACMGLGETGHSEDLYVALMANHGGIN